jgi:hypothetical protein
VKKPATSRGKQAAARARAVAPVPRNSEPTIKAARMTPRKQVSASRGPGGPAKTRQVAESKRHAAAAREADRRVAETRRQSLSSMGQSPVRRAQSGGSRRAPVSSGGGGAVRAVAAGAGGAAALATKVVSAPVAAARPALRVVSGGIEKLPTTNATPAARSRWLILIAGMLAAGLIYINVGTLEAGDGYGKYAERSLELERENTALRAKIANLSSAERIQRYASRRGMVVPAPEQFDYLRAKRGDALKGSRGYKAPEPQTQAVAPAVPQANGTPTANTTPGTVTTTPGTATPQASQPAAPAAPVTAQPPAGGAAPVATVP